MRKTCPKEAYRPSWPKIIFDQTFGFAYLAHCILWSELLISSHLIGKTFATIIYAEVHPLQSTGPNVLTFWVTVYVEFLSTLLEMFSFLSFCSVAQIDFNSSKLCIQSARHQPPSPKDVHRVLLNMKKWSKFVRKLFKKPNLAPKS